MSNAVSALNGKVYGGFAKVSEAGLQGMITLRADLAAPEVKAAVKKVTGCAMPEARRIVTVGGKAVAWMSPDELMLLVPYKDAPAAVAQLDKALAKSHALACDVSDARVLFRVTGAKGGDVLQKLCPVDIAALAPDEIRRTRAAQVACAFWRSGPDEISLVSFRSVAGYVMGLLEHSARPGSELTPG